MTIQYLTLKELYKMDYDDKIFNNISNKADVIKEYTTLKDVYIVCDDGKVKDVLCEDKAFVKFLKQILHFYKEIDTSSFTSTYRCCIISISEIVTKLSYEEFYSRYGGSSDEFS